ncbi:MAG: GPP34 family phosphoprotein [Burkholderiales bacterium]|jgi:Golgi phosphoprotein 3
MTAPNKLTLAEELVLIALDDESGSLLSLPPFSLEVAMAASLLMELELAGRIDSDEQKVFVISPKPTGKAILDEPLEEIVAESRQLPTSAWLRRLAAPGPVLRERVIAGLVDHGVLQSVEKRLLWVFKTRVYPPTSGIEEREVKSRVMTLLNNDEIPDTRDALLIGLLRATGIMYRLLSSTERERLRDRIDQIANLEEINRALSATISELLIELTSASFHP